MADQDMTDLVKIMHTVLDVLTGRRNLPAAEADELHEQITPGYTAEPVSDDDYAAAQEVIRRRDEQRQAADRDEAAEPAAPEPAPAPAEAPPAAPAPGPAPSGEPVTPAGAAPVVAIPPAGDA